MKAGLLAGWPAGWPASFAMEIYLFFYFLGKLFFFTLSLQSYSKFMKIFNPASWLYWAGEWAGWPVGWLAGWLAGRLAGWLAGWLEIPDFHKF